MAFSTMYSNDRARKAASAGTQSVSTSQSKMSDAFMAALEHELANPSPGPSAGELHGIDLKDVERVRR